MTDPTVLPADAVLFDSDGVLVDSHAQVDAAWSRLADEFGLDFEMLRPQIAGVPSRQTLSQYLSGVTLDEAVARIEDLEVETALGTQVIEGAPDLVASLPPGSFAFVTSASRRLADARWSAVGIPIAGHVVTADDVSRGKPDPEPFLTAATMLGVDPSRCVIFEDSVAGGAAAQAAGATVIAVGSTAWAVEATARVRDLRSVAVWPGSNGFALSLAIGPSRPGSAASV